MRPLHFARSLCRMRSTNTPDLADTVRGAYRVWQDRQRIGAASWLLRAAQRSPARLSPPLTSLVRALGRAAAGERHACMPLRAHARAHAACMARTATSTMPSAPWPPLMATTRSVPSVQVTGTTARPTLTDQLNLHWAQPQPNVSGCTSLVFQPFSTIFWDEIQSRREIESRN